MMYNYSFKSTSVKKLSTKKLAATDISNCFLLTPFFPLPLRNSEETGDRKGHGA